MINELNLLNEIPTLNLNEYKHYFSDLNDDAFNPNSSLFKSRPIEEITAIRGYSSQAFYALQGQVGFIKFTLYVKEL